MLIKRDGALPRHMEKKLHRLISYKKMVAISGARGCGKTTLAQKIAKERGMEFVSLDDPITCKQAHRDPKGLIKSLDRTGAVIDEIQRAPVLGGVLTDHLYRDPRPDRFMITSSLKTLLRPEIYFGDEMMRVELNTFSQSEMEGLPSPCGFLADALKDDLVFDDSCGRSVDLWPRILRGCYPAAVLAASSKESRQWLKGYENLLKNRYIKESYKIRSHDKFKKFIIYLAEHSGRWLNLSAIARRLNVKTKTIDHWMVILHHAYIINWFRNDSMDEFGRSDPRRGYKIHFLDSGLLASLCGWSSLDTIINPENRQSLLGSFVHGELRKLITHLGGFSYLNSYETRSGTKVDFVFHQGLRAVGVDVKSSSSLKSSDFEGLRSLKKQMEENTDCLRRLTSGVVFHTGSEIHRSDDGFYGVPVRMLWAPSQVERKDLPVFRKVARA